jgi:hypothetical protein
LSAGCHLRELGASEKDQFTHLHRRRVLRTSY